MGIVENKLDNDIYGLAVTRKEVDETNADISNNIYTYSYS